MSTKDDRDRIIDDINTLMTHVIAIATLKDPPLSDLKSIQRTLVKWIEKQHDRLESN